MSRDSDVEGGTALVTIGVPTFNRAGLLERAVKSILAQTYQNIEVIIADDASPDSTEDVCRELLRNDERVRYVRHERNIGAEDNFLYVLGEATGSYFMWLSDDDAFEPTFLLKAVDVLESDPGTVACFCDYYIVNEEQEVQMVWRHEHLYPEASWEEGRVDFFTIPYTISSTVFAGLFRTEVVRGVRRPMSLTFLRLMNGHESVFLANVAATGRIVVLPELLFYAMGHHNTQGSLTYLVSSGLNWFERVVLKITLHSRVILAALTARLPWKQRLHLAGASIGAMSRHAASWVAARWRRAPPGAAPDGREN